MSWRAVMTAWYTLYDAVIACCFSESPKYENMSWELCNLETSERTLGLTHHEFRMTSEYPVLLHNVRRVRGVTSVTKTAIHWVDDSRAPYFYSHLFDQPPAPWFFIGYRNADGTVVDCTADLDRFVVYDNYITVELLYTLIPASKGKTWAYIHPKTFEEVEFPSEGILIEDDDSTGDDSKTD
jgi:hypothetical protein